MQGCNAPALLNLSIMKYAIFSLCIVGLFACEKNKKACYTCTQKYTLYQGGQGFNYTDTTKYCEKTEEDIQGIIDAAPVGTQGSRYYMKKSCKKD